MSSWYSKIPEMVGEDWIQNQVIFDPEVGTPVYVVVGGEKS